ncbi:hypothetical protein BDV95DRAFT_16569 [Massariosphaeria phaeospora]|uniref:Uncharacterized protein n=1 Tax=Massariosphaeria phaeospora TaxID=100035 RepID=A0A7C8II77_9PLEO|nr:hypothetical protein BDV95DRAFT_16569 [Massariosphaeria phaeospora]
MAHGLQFSQRDRSRSPPWIREIEEAEVRFMHKKSRNQRFALSTKRTRIRGPPYRIKRQFARAPPRPDVEEDYGGPSMRLYLRPHPVVLILKDALLAVRHLTWLSHLAPVAGQQSGESIGQPWVVIAVTSTECTASGSIGWAVSSCAWCCEDELRNAFLTWRRQAV